MRLNDLTLAGDRRSSAFRIVTRDVGALLALIGAAMLAPLAVSLLYGETWTALGFLASSLVCLACGLVAHRWFRDAGDPERRHAMMIAAAGWLTISMFGSMPFLLAAYLTPAEVLRKWSPSPGVPSSLVHFRNPLHALFESMSAFTTTGLTMAVHEPSIGHGLLFYRSLAQWIGGAGVIVLSLAIIPRPRAVGGLELYQSETAGMKLRPSILGTARAIWKIYASMTFLVALYLFVALIVILPEYGAARSLFDAVNHAMTAQSTGGFSTLDDSIAGYGSWIVEAVHIPPMVLGAISIPLYYTLFRRRDARVLWRDAQFRSMLLLFAAGSPLLAVVLAGSPAVAAPVRESLFQVVSAVSTTGWQTSEIGAWGDSALLLLAWGAMVIGGAAGATVGGIKLIRAYILTRAVSWRVRKALLPAEAIVPFRIDDRSLPDAAMQREVSDAALLSFLYIVVLGASVLVVSWSYGTAATLASVMFECVSAQSTVGLSTGLTDPAMPVVAEIVFIVQMWVGRLEIFPIVVLITALLRTVRR
jgi:trk system potassium uptake protein